MNLAEQYADDYGAPVYHKYLEYLGPNEDNVSGKSDKFWEVAVFRVPGGFDVITRWGKFGSKGQSKRSFTRSKYTAGDSAATQARKKRAKGYTREVDVITRMGALLGDD